MKKEYFSILSKKLSHLPLVQSYSLKKSKHQQIKNPENSRMSCVVSLVLRIWEGKSMAYRMC